MSTEVATIDYRGTDLYVEGEGVSIRPMCVAMGVDADAQVARIKRSPWSTGWTSVTKVQVPGDMQARDHFFLHRRRVPMWIAGLQPERIPDETVRVTVIRWQEEIADVLADYYEGRSATVRTPRRKRIAGTGTPFPDELEFLKLSGARRVKLPSGFEIEFATEGIEYALSLVKEAVREEVGDHEALLAEVQEARKGVQKERSDFAIQQAGGIPPTPKLRPGYPDLPSNW